jgi:hypothetical protein
MGSNPTFNWLLKSELGWKPTFERTPAYPGLGSSANAQAAIFSKNKNSRKDVAHSIRGAEKSWRTRALEPTALPFAR